MNTVSIQELKINDEVEVLLTIETSRRILFFNTPTEVRTEKRWGKLIKIDNDEKKFLVELFDCPVDTNPNWIKQKNVLQVKYPLS